VEELEEVCVDVDVEVLAVELDDVSVDVEVLVEADVDVLVDDVVTVVGMNPEPRLMVGRASPISPGASPRAIESS